jgi:hypothetical protein
MRAPMWYLRLTHTRLADCILELCGVPPKETLRRIAFRVLTHATAPSPCHLFGIFPNTRKPSRQASAMAKESLDVMLSDAVSRHGLPPVAANNLRVFITRGCMPLPIDFRDAIDRVQHAVSQLRQKGDQMKADARRLKRFDDVGRSLKSLKALSDLLSSIGIAPCFGATSVNPNSKGRLNRPLYLSLDLGLRQRRKHVHGLLLFQGIMIPDDYFEQHHANDVQFETNDRFISPSGGGSRIAEGGRYDELVSFCRVGSYWFVNKLLMLFYSVGSKVPPTRQLWLRSLQLLHRRSHSNGKFASLLIVLFLV